VGLAGYLADRGLSGPDALRGLALPRIGTHEALSREAACSARAEQRDRCTLCGRCVTACRDGGYGAISIAGGTVTVDEGRCDGCGLCSLVCPEGVMVVRPRSQVNERSAALLLSGKGLPE